jgi:hypothetical protein
MSEVDSVDYDQFVDLSPQGNLYCHTWWLDAVAPGHYEILTAKSGNAIKAAWPIVWAEGAWRRRARMPRLTARLGVLLSPFEGKYAEGLSREHELIDSLLSQLPEGCLVDMWCHESFTNWLPFCWRGFEQTTRYTYVLEDLSDVDRIWDDMRRTARTEIRKAEKRNVRVRETDDLEKLYQITSIIFARQGLKMPYDLAYLERIDSACRQHAGRRILLAETPNGETCACRYLVYDQQCAFLVCGGVTDAMRGSGANSLVDWEMIKFACTVSKRFDFTGSIGARVEPYLRTFGAKRVPFFSIWGKIESKTRWARVRRLAGHALHKLALAVEGRTK